MRKWRVIQDFYLGESIRIKAINPNEDNFMLYEGAIIYEAENTDRVIINGNIHLMSPDHSSVLEMAYRSRPLPMYKHKKSRPPEPIIQWISLEKKTRESGECEDRIGRMFRSVDLKLQRDVVQLSEDYSGYKRLVKMVGQQFPDQPEMVAKIENEAQKEIGKLYISVVMLLRERKWKQSDKCLTYEAIFDDEYYFSSFFEAAQLTLFDSICRACSNVGKVQTKAS